MIVVDASVAVAVILTEPECGEALSTLKTTDILHAPSLLVYEVTNSIAAAVRRERMTETESHIAVARFNELPWSFETHAGTLRVDDVLQLAIRHRLSAYNASYLELALRCKCPIATLDFELRKASKKEELQVLLRDRKRRT